MEESKELQGFYKMFRSLVYVSLLMEFFAYALTPEILSGWGSIVCDLHARIRQWSVYAPGHLTMSKLVTLLLICITCIGTRNRKNLEFNAMRQVVYPLCFGLLLLLVAVWLYHIPDCAAWAGIPWNVWCYMEASLVGVILVHVSLDNVSKYLKDGLLKDRFNFENKSFEQATEAVVNKYSVNIPMRFYHKGRFRKGFVSISNPFRGTWVVGTPGSGKTFSIIEPFIRQHSAKGFAMVIYDYKYPTLANKAYYNYLKNKAEDKLPKGCKFRVINFVDVNR